VLLKEAPKYRFDDRQIKRLNITSKNNKVGFRTFIPTPPHSTEKAELKAASQPLFTLEGGIYPIREY
jgi:hypothetical protein